MNSVTDEIRLAGKGYRDKLKKDKKEIRLNTEKQIKNKIRKLKKLRKTIKCIIINYKKQKRQKNCERKAIWIE